MEIFAKWYWFSLALKIMICSKLASSTQIQRLFLLYFYIQLSAKFSFLHNSDIEHLLINRFPTNASHTALMIWYFQSISIGWFTGNLGNPAHWIVLKASILGFIIQLLNLILVRATIITARKISRELLQCRMLKFNS